jgi:hypothetical protein
VRHPAFPDVVFGDNDVAVCFYAGGGIVGRAIRWQTRSKVGHTATFMPRWQSWIEADARKGVILRGEERPDRVDFAVVTLPNYNAADVFAFQSIGASYDKRMILRFLTRQKEAKGTADDFFCSEHTSSLLRHGGVVALAHSEPWEESPGDLYLSPILFPQKSSVLSRAA